MVASNLFVGKVEEKAEERRSRGEEGGGAEEAPRSWRRTHWVSLVVAAENRKLHRLHVMDLS